MKETPEQYTQRVLSYQEGQDPLAIQRATGKKLQGFIKGLTPRQLKQRPAPDKWSIAEILAHLSDTEMVVGYRLRMILSQNGTPIQAFDQDLWAQACNYAAQDAKTSVAEFQLLRAKNLALLKSIPQALWENYGLHAERGKETVGRVVSMIAGHDLNHLGQIERIRKSFRSK